MIDTHNPNVWHNPDVWRLIIFFGLLVTFAILEAVLPKKRRTSVRRERWITNVSLAVINTLVIRLLGPIIAVNAALYAMQNGWGILNHINISSLFKLGIALVLLDLSIYIHHVLFHKWSFLWRFHKMHHTDRDIDVTTGIRFHPGEALISMLYKCVIILVLGPAVFAVILFEIILNGMALFNHANIRLPSSLDRIMRLFIVTPDMHRVHHSIRPDETDSNYGFSLSLWDRVFQTYKHHPQDGHEAMTIGLSEHQSDKPSRLGWSLILPFKG